MVDIINEITRWSEIKHNYEGNIVLFEKETTDDFARIMRDWFSSLDKTYHNALIALSFDRAITTSMMFFSRQNMIPYKYDGLMLSIIRFITSENAIKKQKEDCFNMPRGLWTAFSDYRLLNEARERVVNKNNDVLSILSPELKNQVLEELLEHDVEYKYLSKALVDTLTNYRKKILNLAITSVANENKKEG